MSARRDARERRKALLAAAQEAGGERGCLFCRASDGGFTSLEHVVAEALANVQAVLPVGVVCDRCNNGPLSELDQTVSDFFPLRIARTMWGVPGKSGTIPETRLSTGTLRNLGANELAIELNRAADRTTIQETGRDGDRVELQLNWTGGRRMTARYASDLSRALLKSALEFAWIDHGLATLDADYDHLRRAVLGDAREGFLLVGHHGDPNHRGLALRYWLQHDSAGLHVYTEAKFHGVTLATDSRLAWPVGVEPPTGAHMVNFSHADFPSRS